MKSFPIAIVDFILHQRKLIIITISLLTLFFAYQLKNLTVYGEFDVWYKDSDPILRVYNEFVESFGSDEHVVLIYRSDSLLSDDELKFNQEISNQLVSLEGVHGVISLSNMNIPLKYGMPILENNFLSKDGKSTGILVIPEDAGSNRDILSGIKSIVDELREAGYPAHIFGPLSIKEEVHQLANREAGKFLLIAVGIMIGLLYLLLRNMIVAVLPVILALITVVWTLGIFVITGHSMNVVTSIMPLILLVISIAFSIHVIFTYRASMAPGKSLKEVFQLTYIHVLAPCFYSAITSSGAFLVFGLSEIKPLVLFGVFSAMGVIIAFSLTFLILPTLFRFLRLDIRMTSLPEQSPLRFSHLRLASWVYHNRILIILSSCLVFIISILGITRIEFSADQLRYFKESNQVSIANHTAEKWFGGVYPTEVVLEFPVSMLNDLQGGIQILEKIETDFANFNEISSWQSPLVVLKSIIPNQNEREQWIQYMSRSGAEQLMAGETGALLDQFISEDGMKTRISVKSKWMDSQETMNFVQKLDSSIEKSLKGEKVKYHLTGLTAMLSTMSQRLTMSQIVSIIGAMIIIFILLLIIYRKFSMALIGMIPNLFPVITTIGIMGWLGIPLDVATVLLASVSLGIAIDDTIHFLTVYKSAAHSKNRVESISECYSRIGKPISITTLLLIGGFLVMVFSNYIPIIYLGIFVSINVFLALVYDLLLLPALLLKKNEN